MRITIYLITGAVAISLLCFWHPKTKHAKPSIELVTPTPFSLIQPDGSVPYTAHGDVRLLPAPGSLDEAIEYGQRNPGKWVKGPNGHPLRVLKMERVDGLLVPATPAPDVK